MKVLSNKEKAIKYRMKGYSYNMICEILGIGKSTIANWTSNIPYTPNREVIQRISSAKLKSATFKHNQKMAEANEMKELAREELGKITNRDLWLLGIGLYLGEGTKSHEFVRVVNSDHPQSHKTCNKVV